MKNGNMTVVYGIVAAVSVLIMVFYLVTEKKRERNFLLLTVCVALVNCGYFVLSMAKSCVAARVFNAISYLGAAYSVLAMLLIIWDVCRMPKCNRIKWLLIGVSTAAFLLAASGDLLGLYYKSIHLEFVSGMTLLRKEYGPLHILYTVYLLSYVLTMIGLILYAAKKKRLAAPKYTMLLLCAVLLNIGVWAVEQATDVNFEFLSVSYVVTEVILLLIYSLLREYGIVRPGGDVLSCQMLKKLHEQNAAGQLHPGMEQLFRDFLAKVDTLTSAERRILEYYIAGHEIADIPDLAFISINTVKKHNRSIYQKLEVASRDELMLYIELFRCCGRLEQLHPEQKEECLDILHN